MRRSFLHPRHVVDRRVQLEEIRVLVELRVRDQQGAVATHRSGAAPCSIAFCATSAMVLSLVSPSIVMVFVSSPSCQRISR